MFRNFSTIHHRIMARYLEKRGWVVFYLEEEHRICKNGHCWLELYQDILKRQNEPIEEDYEEIEEAMVLND